MHACRGRCGNVCGVWGAANAIPTSVQRPLTAPPPPLPHLAPPACAGLPNEMWSSDHVALMVEFNYVQPPAAAGTPGAASGTPSGGGSAAAAAPAAGS